MTNVELLNEIIKNSGYKVSHLAEKCGLTRAGFWKKATGNTEFKASEIKVLKEALRLNAKQVESIFFN